MDQQGGESANGSLVRRTKGWGNDTAEKIRSDIETMESIAEED